MGHWPGRAMRMVNRHDASHVACHVQIDKLLSGTPFKYTLHRHALEYIREVCSFGAARLTAESCV